VIAEPALYCHTAGTWSYCGGGTGGGAAENAPYVTTAAVPELTAERVLQSGANTTVTIGAGTVQVDVPAATTTTRGAVILSGDSEATAGEAVQATDTRLTDARPPTAHATSHQDLGADELSIAGLSGLAADTQTPTAHAASHQDLGTDELSIAGLSGLAADAQLPTAHAASHQDLGADELSIAGLSGLAADAQTPTAHATSHQDAGADELSIAGLSGLAADAQTPTAHANIHALGGSDPVTAVAVQGSTVSALPACAPATHGLLRVVTDPADEDDCLAGLGTSPPHTCACDGPSGLWRVDRRARIVWSAPLDAIQIGSQDGQMVIEAVTSGPKPMIPTTDGRSCRAGVLPCAETFCSAGCPCDLGQGDCDSDAECLGDLVCRSATLEEVEPYCTAVPAGFQVCDEP
jgi:hypothetical protein